MSRSSNVAGRIRGAGGLLTVDLDAIATNYRTLAARLGPATQCGGVVKADAYGLGLAPVARTLWETGCRHFFVALTEEGIALRALLPEARIYIFDGVDQETTPDTAAHTLIPVLSHPGQVETWETFAGAQETRLPALLQVDTGMNRLGLSPAEADTLLSDPDSVAALDVDGVMSHLACADEPDHPQNAQQLQNFRDMIAKLEPLAPGTASLANSSGVFLDPAFHFDLARPGAALWGINPQPGSPNPMAQVVKLQGKILQTRTIDTPSAVGYGATHRVRRGARIATIGIGYADGFFRSLSNSASAFIGGIRVPVVGRVSMDLITIDVSAVPAEATQAGNLVDIISPQHPVDDLAREAGTIGYEVLTALGRRLERRYLGGGAGS